MAGNLVSILGISSGKGRGPRQPEAGYDRGWLLPEKIRVRACKCCGTKIPRELMTGKVCPFCHEDVRGSSGSA